jgi:hypothetical protein
VPTARSRASGPDARGLLVVSRQIRSEFRSIYWSGTAAQVPFEDLPMFLQFFSPDPGGNMVFPPRVTIIVSATGHSHGISFDILPLLAIKAEVPKVTWALKPAKGGQLCGFSRHVEDTIAFVTCRVLKQVLDHDLLKIIIDMSYFSLVSMKFHLRTIGVSEWQLTLQKQGGRLHDEEKCDMELCCNWLNLIPENARTLAGFEAIKKHCIGLPELTVLVVDCDSSLRERYIWNALQNTLNRQSLA